MSLITGADLRALAADCVGCQSSQPGYAELDITLGDHFFQEKIEPTCLRTHCMKPDKWADLWDRKPVPDTGLVLKSGQFVLAETAEFFLVPDDIYGVLTLRSWAAKSGLDQSSSLTLKPGWNGTLILELHNALQYHELLLEKGASIGQIQFFRIGG